MTVAAQSRKEHIAQLRSEMLAAESAWLDTVTAAHQAHERQEKARQALNMAQSAYVTYVSVLLEAEGLS